MLNPMIFEVLKNILDGEIFSVECDLSRISDRRTIYITTSQTMTEENFIKKTKSIISEKDISFSDNFHFNIDLTEELINKFMTYTKTSCLNEFENMKQK